MLPNIRSYLDNADGRGRIGLIQPVSQPFCEACDRLRLTAEG
jgi:cyclic pyranopterin phosphate synthase